MFVKTIHNKTKSLMGLLMIVSISGCGSNANTNDTASNTPQVSEHTSEMKVFKSINEPKQANQQMILKGQILYQQMEGGFYGFVAHNGDKYMPTGLHDKYRKNGLIVELKVEVMSDTLTIQQFGEVIKILEIKVLDSSKVSTPDKSL
jgi:hypothetical protein